MYVVFGTKRFSAVDRDEDCYEVCTSELSAKARLSQWAGEENSYCAGIAKIVDATEPHWLDRPSIYVEGIDPDLLNLPFGERNSLQWPMTPELLMGGAMVLWEAVLDGLEWPANQVPAADPLTAWYEYVGTAQARNDLMPFVVALHIGWSVHYHAVGRVEETDHLVLAPFDWEFTPWFLRNCIVPEHNGHVWTLTLADDWLDKCRNARAE